jgi:putative NAD(P)-binding protein
MSSVQHSTAAINGIEEPIEKNGSAGNGSSQQDVRTRCRDRPIHANRHMRVVCIGAGASGIYLAYKLKHYFTDFTLDVYEKNLGVGGTWFENRYPGCTFSFPFPCTSVNWSSAGACDVPA